MRLSDLPEVACQNVSNMENFTYILPVVIVLSAMVLAFINRLPSSAVAFVGMILSWAFGWGLFTSGTLWFWGVAMLIATGINYLAYLPPLPSLRRYIVGGTLTGSVLGVLAGSMASLITGAVIGAALGFIAFRRTPTGRINAPTSVTLSIFADIALPAAVTFCISIITLAQLPLFNSL